MPIINPIYSSDSNLPPLTNPALASDVLRGKEYIDGNGEKQVGVAPNYTKLLQAQGIIPANAGSIDLVNEDFGIYTAVNGIFAFNAAQGNNHPLRSITASGLTSIGQMAYTKNLKYMRVSNFAFSGNQAQFSGLRFVDCENSTFNFNQIFRDTLLNTIIIRDETIPLIGYSGIFFNTPIGNGNGHIYVPVNLVESYKIATIWSTFASAYMPLYVVSSEVERQEKLADSSVIDGSMIVYDDGEWDFETMTGTRYTVKGSV